MCDKKEGQILLSVLEKVTMYNTFRYHSIVSVRKFEDIKRIQSKTDRQCNGQKKKVKKWSTPCCKWSSLRPIFSFVCRVLPTIVCLLSFGHCIVCPSIYGFRLLLSYLSSNFSGFFFCYVLFYIWIHFNLELRHSIR
jgi:hypothetical protein